MSFLCWNGHGLGNPQTDQGLGDLIWAQDPSVLFLTETWLDKARLEEIKVRCKFGGSIEVSKENQGGGIAIFWKADYDLSMDTYSINHIDAIVNKGKEGEWRFTGFYGEPDTAKCHESWAKLRCLRNRHSMPWLCVGDFNEICRAHKKLGGRLRPLKQMEDFKEVLDECGFQDLGFIGNKFTWCNGHKKGYTIWERLDRAVATTDWVARFQQQKSFI
ncbi:uncharacterized protein LOC142635222 [Castanea sativa]|uniref:uncharacterized protein LOC142635222 n=1 Tax=Castanea sativa TaxID=21020 RepID=UPI003F6522F4